MNIGIIGSGRKNIAIAKRWSSVGHAIRFASYEGLEISDLNANLKNFEIDKIDEVVKFGEVNFFNVADGYYFETVEQIRHAEGKIFIDATAPDTRILKHESLGETLSGFFPKAHVVKSFCYVNPEVLELPMANGEEKPYLFYAGDDELSKTVVQRLIADAGFTPLDIGPLKMAKQLEQLAVLNASVRKAIGIPEYLITLDRTRVL